jgi:dipeptidyl aminopeptidase/acylaminoacyl peptidase
MGSFHFDSDWYRRLLARLLVFIALSFMAACTAAPIEPGFGGAQESPKPANTVTRSERATRRRPDPPTPNLTLTTTPWDPDAPRPTQTPVPPPPELLYNDTEGLWQIGPDWQPSLVIDQAGATLSPDGSQAFYQEENEIWLIDIATGQRRNLTENRDRHHCCVQWWPAKPGVLVLGSWLDGDDLGPSTGYLTILDTVSGDYSVLETDAPSNGIPAPGPDDHRIAYDRAGEAWIYDLDTGPEPLDPGVFGLTGIVRIGGPAWSPDGQHLAWTAAISDPGWKIVLVVFDLTSQSAWLLHPYEPAGRGGWFPPPAWSPDGQYLAFVSEDINPEMAGVWVVAVDGSEERYIGAGANPSWSPDGRWLMFTGYEGVGEDQIPAAWLVDVPSWYILRMDRPDDTTFIGWPPGD